MTDIPLCSLCDELGRDPQPMHQTVSGAWVCPICDRNVPHRPTKKKKDH